jgi:hypothetical protein
MAGITTPPRGRGWCHEAIPDSFARRAGAFRRSVALCGVGWLAQAAGTHVEDGAMTGASLQGGRIVYSVVHGEVDDAARAEIDRALARLQRMLV